MLAILATAALCIANVHDGDTIRLCDGEKVRVANIDAPELRGSPSCAPRKRASHWCDYDRGEASKLALIDFLARGPARLKPTGRIDRFGRNLALIEVNGEDAGAYLIARGLARRWR